MNSLVYTLSVPQKIDQLHSYKTITALRKEIINEIHPYCVHGFKPDLLGDC